jgi:hypothetical protein
MIPTSRVQASVVVGGSPAVPREKDDRGFGKRQVPHRDDHRPADDNRNNAADNLQEHELGMKQVFPLARRRCEQEDRQGKHIARQNNLAEGLGFDEHFADAVDHAEARDRCNQKQDAAQVIR